MGQLARDISGAAASAARSQCIRDRGVLSVFGRGVPGHRGAAPAGAEARGHGRSFSRFVITRLSGGQSSIDQQRRAGGKFRRVGSKVKDGGRDFFAGAQPTHGMQRY